MICPSRDLGNPHRDCGEFCGDVLEMVRGVELERDKHFPKRIIFENLTFLRSDLCDELQPFVLSPIVCDEPIAAWKIGREPKVESPHIVLPSIM